MLLHNNCIYYLKMFFCFIIFSNSPKLNAEGFSRLESKRLKEIEQMEILHECGISLIRLRKPMQYYVERYSDASWGIKKLLLLMEKQRHRGQDGAGIAVIKLKVSPGEKHLHRIRFSGNNSLNDIEKRVISNLNNLKNDPNLLLDAKKSKLQSPYIGEILLGHLRYATHSGNDLKYCQPFVRSHYFPSCHFALAGNFNMTNTSELFQQLENLGIFLNNKSDTSVILNMLAYYFDQASKKNVNDIHKIKSKNENDLLDSLKQAAKSWDGGYVFCGIIGNGDLFACRDPAGIRPGYYFINDEVIAVASERAALLSAFNSSGEDIYPIKPGHVIIVKQNGEISENIFTPPICEKQCVFERIYFSSASDPQVYQDRKNLGKNLALKVFEALEKDIENVLFTYVPNSSFPSFLGLTEEIAHLSHQSILKQIKNDFEKGIFSFDKINKLANNKMKIEQLIKKNQKLRTFITCDQKRKNLINQLYEITKGIVKPETTLVVMDDSIVRGTTLRESLMEKLIKLNPKKIIFVSSAPPVMYPDCYGIDMSQIGRFVAFQAVIALLEERKEKKLLDEVNQICLQQKDLQAFQIQNTVMKLYEHFNLEEISNKIAELIIPSNIEWNGSFQIIYQSIEGLHKSIPNFSGDWCFSGIYPTPGGLKVLNNSYLKWYLNDDSRSY